VKPDINSLDVHPQLSHYRHPIDDALEGGGDHPSKKKKKLGEIWLQMNYESFLKI
jgi:hypothetical protein